MSTQAKTPVTKVVADKYTLENPVGSGQFGDVYKAKVISTNEYVAVKCIELDLFDNPDRLHEMSEHEVGILSKIKNPNVVQFIETIKTKTHIYTVYELCTGGTLEELLDRRKYLTEKEAFQILRQLLNGFRPLVALNIMHRDIKPSNILFQGNVAKISDFGFSKPLVSSCEVTETMIGSPIYMAPEILKGLTYTIKADIYSMGVMLFEMLYGKAPFEDVNIPGLLNKISKGDIVFRSYNPISPSTEFLIKRMLEPIESQRITWQEIFQSFSLDPSPESANKTSEAGQDNLNLGGIEEAKLDTGILKNFTISQNGGGERDTELILTLFTQDCKQLRDKTMFLWRTFSQGYNNLIDDESHIVNYLTLRKILGYCGEITKILQNKQSVMTKEEYDNLKSQFDYNRLSTILTSETAKFQEALSIYKNFIYTMADPTKTDRIDNDPAFQAKEFSESMFEGRVLNFAKKIRQRFNGPNDASNGSVSNLALYLNLLLDSIMIDEMYANFFEIGTPFNEQPYLHNLFEMDESELLELADEKIAYK